MDLFEITTKKRTRDDDHERPMIEFETRVYYNEVVYTIETVKPAAEMADPAVSASESSDAESVEEIIERPTLSSEDFYNEFVVRTQEQCEAELLAPQRSLEWLEARRHCITASNFGAAVGHNKYATPNSVALDKLWSTFKGNSFTAYGTYHESDAQKSFVNIINGPLHSNLKILYKNGTGGLYKSFQLFETGLLKHYKQPWMAVSPDGLLRLSGTSGPMWILVEYKCPARLRDSSGHPYATSPNNVPEYYGDQMQGIMGLFNKFPDLLNGKGMNVVAESQVYDTTEAPTENDAYFTVPMAFFVVWQPRQVHVTLVPYKHEYYTKSLEPALENWFFETYLPLAVLKHNGSLVPGTATTAPVIEVS